MEPKAVALVIIDISGYTRFILSNRTSLVHAQEIVSQLLESVVDSASHPLVLNKFEGDAAFLYAVLGEDPRAAARDIARQVDGFFAAFHARARELSGVRANCPCGACQRVLALQLKAVMHAGSVAFRKIRQFEEVAGEDVIVAHRLLKNSVEGHEYLLMTEAFHGLLGEAGAASGQARQEHYEDLGTVPVRVYPPGEWGKRIGRSDGHGERIL
jgi:class 3 adenylate cyclase